MQQQTKQSPPPANRPAQQQQQDPKKLLEEILDRAPSQQYGVVENWFLKNVAKLEEVLPGRMRGQGMRLIRRALMTLKEKPDLQKCPADSFVLAVLKAAELGLAIDGKLAYCVPYKGVWQLQLDYKGLIAVCRRAGQLRDCYADVVCENDFFEASRINDTSRLEHKRARFGEDRGQVIGAYAVMKQANGCWRYELMDLAEIEAIRARSPAFNSPRGKSGPWVTDENEMRKKTVIRRLLKTYCDDPAVAGALALTSGADEEEELEVTTEGPPVGRVGLGRNGAGATEATQEEQGTEERQPGDDSGQEGGSGFDEEQERKTAIERFDATIDNCKDAATAGHILDSIDRVAEILGTDEQARLNKRTNDKLAELQAASAAKRTPRRI